MYGHFSGLFLRASSGIYSNPVYSWEERIIVNHLAARIYYSRHFTFPRGSRKDDLRDRDFQV